MLIWTDHKAAAQTFSMVLGSFMKRRQSQNINRASPRRPHLLKRCTQALKLALAIISYGCVNPLAAQMLWSSPAFTLPGQHSGAITSILAAGLILILGIISLMYLRLKHQTRENKANHQREISQLLDRLDRLETFFALETQIMISWQGFDENPEIEGDLSLITHDQQTYGTAAFGAWLPPSPAKKLETAVDRLRNFGEAFKFAVTNKAGRHLDIEGRPIGSRAVLRIRDVSNERHDFLSLREEHQQTLEEFESLRTLFDAIPHPAWSRGLDGELTWVNSAYAKAVEGATPSAAISQGIELFDRPAREASAAKRREGQTWKTRSPAVVASQRRILDLIEVPVRMGSVGLATDVSELETLRGSLTRQTQAHAQTLDQLSTAVAIFDPAKRLIFHNAAYRQLWGFDQAMLDQNPTDPELLDRLRAAQLLPEQVDFRAWKEALHSSYQAMEPNSQAWYLPDGRTLHVIINPHPQGGVTYLFDDITQRYHLESRFNTLISVQGETLDALKEGVAVFGSDGRLKLFNPAFAKMWNFTPDILVSGPHIDQVAENCVPLCTEETVWQALRSAIAGMQDQRLSFERRIALRDGSFLDCATAPLPDGATLLTFIDTTASVNVERALTERNQALIDAEKLRNDFVHHVSYELRSPLTNIIGFTQFVGDGSIGDLNPKQREYLGYVSKSSSALLAIIDDILDLASIDIDALELSIEEVDIAQTMQAASEGVQDRLLESNLTLLVIATEAIGGFLADGKRIRQILFNLLSNAIGFSEPGQTVTLAALRRGSEVVFKVSDQGRGIPPAIVEQVFERFKTETRGSRHHGVGLGLSIVRAFVELHGGRVLIDTAPGLGTTVTCIFPARNAKLARGGTA